MHTVPPPKELLDEWLDPYPSAVGRYGHLLLEQLTPSEDTISAGLSPYFESAHADAREYFHAFAGISLHPDDGNAGCDAQYPNSLPLKTRHGLFGEVMSGMITEAFPFIGDHEWVIPVFLFRNHEDARQYIYQLAREPDRVREIQGRKGDDFIALVIDDKGNVTRFIAGEAKWRQRWNPSTLARVMYGDPVKDEKTGETKPNGRGVWFEINRALNVPIGLRQLQEILKEREPDEYADVILSLDRILLVKNPDPVGRTDLILLAGGSPAHREKRVPLLPWEQLPEDYKAGRDLQVVEILIEDGEQLIKTLYDRLWREAVDASD